MEHKKIIVGVAVVIVGIAFVLFNSNKAVQTNTTLDTSNQVVSQYDHVDVVLDFYQPWMRAIQSTSTDPYTDGLAAAPILSPALRDRLSSTSEDENDPVICQNPIPTTINTRTLYEQPEKSQVLVYSKEQELAGQAIVTLLRANDGWYIDDILCSRGEFDIEREFTFVYDGNLLKSVPPPYNPDYWHLVYTQDGTPGYAAQLFFDQDSICIDQNNNESVCDTTKFVDAAKVNLAGNMTETGVEVKKVTFTE